VKDIVQPFVWRGGELCILDQRKLPGRETWIRARDAETVARAIETLAVRGAPAIGIAAGYGVALAALHSRATTDSVLRAIERLRRTRPTGYNLFHILDVMTQMVTMGRGNLGARVLKRAQQCHAEDVRACLAMARYGVSLLKNDERVLTYCNTGALATGGIGTALGVIKLGFSRGIVREVFACETRPVAQGARLTVWECAKSGIPVTLLCDNMVAALLQTGRVTRIFVGADRIARNGDTSNKIGTLQLALMAKRFAIPFHVAAPTTTFDKRLRTGKAIPIEERTPDEILKGVPGLARLKGVRVWNPAFDVTPGCLVTSYITEKGIKHPPFLF
jgi:methylthioribose-1-phosphate isomerase